MNEVNIKSSLARLPEVPKVSADTTTAQAILRQYQLLAGVIGYEGSLFSMFPNNADNDVENPNYADLNLDFGRAINAGAQKPTISDQVKGILATLNGLEARPDGGNYDKVAAIELASQAKNA